MGNKRIYQLDDIGTYTNIDDGDFLHISDTSDGNKDKKVSILNILKKILGNRVFTLQSIKSRIETLPLQFSKNCSLRFLLYSPLNQGLKHDDRSGGGES